MIECMVRESNHEDWSDFIGDQNTEDFNSGETLRRIEMQIFKDL